MRKSNKLIIIISIILVVAIAGCVFAYLFIATDIFKSNRELFGKYFIQELENLEKITQFKTIDTYQNLTNETKYESNTDVKVIHSEGGEISNPLNNLSMKLDVQKDNDQQYYYGNGKISFENEGYLEAEIIKEQEQYGIRFPDIFIQFVTIDQDENIQAIADDLGIDVSILEIIIKIMNGTEEIVSEEQINTTKDEILNTLTTEISNGFFERQRNAMITYNGVTTKTNAYSVSLTSEQVRKILLEISENVSDEIEVPAAKIIVYEQSEQIIRTVIEIGENKITIENLEQVGELKTKITYSNLSNEKAIECVFEITKTYSDNQESLEIIADVLEGEEMHEITFLSEMQASNDEINFDLEISYKQDITTMSLVLENVVNIGSDFEKSQTLTEENMKSLSSIEDEARRKQIINSLKQIVIQQTTGKISILMEKLMLNIQDNNTESETQEPVQDISQAEINNFNAKFEFYTGEEISAENVKVLLDIVKGNCNGHTIMAVEPTENEENTEMESIVAKNSMILYIEEGATNDESIAKVFEQIDDNKKYKVLISYKEINGLIDYITITEI